MSNPNLAAIQHELGVELPDSYVSLIEDHGLPSVEAFTFYDLQNLHWFEDHELAQVVPYEGRALVIGVDTAGNAVVFLGFDVAGKPALSDEVYLIDHEVGEPEELAMDFPELIEDLGGIAHVGVETLWETAFVVRATRAKTVAALRQALSARGYDESSDEWDGGGAYLRIRVAGKGPVVVWVRTEEASLWLARRLAVILGRSIEAFEVALKDEVVKDDNGEQGFPFQARRLKVLDDGMMADLETGLDNDVANAGDPYETAISALREMVDRPLRDESEVLEFFRPALPDDLSPRLAALLAAIGESNAVDLTEIAGQPAVRVELPDGTRQMSVVSDEELKALRRHAQIE